MKKSLSIILVILMLVSCIPIMASAADPITLTNSNLILLEAPKMTYGDQIEVEKLTVTWGVKANQITLVGGKIGYIAEEGAEPVYIPGKLSITTSSTLAVGENTYVASSMKFTPDDLNAYSTCTIRRTIKLAEGVTYPRVKVLPVTATLVENPTYNTVIPIGTALTAGVGAAGGKVVDASGTEISGTWSMVDSRVMDTEGTFEETLQWKKTGYETILIPITVTVKAMTATLKEAPTLTEINITNNRSRLVKITGGVVLDESGNEITDGTWTKSDLPDYLYVDTPITLTWTKTGYAPIVFETYVKVIQNHANYNIERPAKFLNAMETRTYDPSYTYEDIERQDAIIKDKEGNIVPGTYEYYNGETVGDLYRYTGSVRATEQNRKVCIHFVPEDTTLPRFYFYDKIGIVNKAEFSIGDNTEIVLNYGETVSMPLEMKKDDLRFSTIEVIPSNVEIYTVYWSLDTFDPKTAEVNSVTMVEAIFRVEAGILNGGVNYTETYTKTVPVRIQPRIIDGDFSHGTADKTAHGTNEGSFRWGVNFKDSQLFGDVKVYATTGDERFEVATVSPDETGKRDESGEWRAPKDGKYYFNFEYIPTDKDIATITGSLIKQRGPFEIDIRLDRNLKVIMGDMSKDFVLAEKESFAYTKIKEMYDDYDKEKFDKWIATDGEGNPITLTYLGEPIDTSKYYIYFDMPEHDVILRAKAIGEIDIGGNTDGGFDLLGILKNIFDKICNFFKQIIEFFKNLSFDNFIEKK